MRLLVLLLMSGFVSSSSFARESDLGQAKERSCVEGHIDVFLQKLSDHVKRLLTDFGRVNRVTFDLSTVALEVKSISGQYIAVDFQSPVSAGNSEFLLSFVHMPHQYFRAKVRGSGWDEEGRVVGPFQCLMVLTNSTSLVIRDAKGDKVIGQISMPTSFNIPIY